MHKTVYKNANDISKLSVAHDDNIQYILRVINLSYRFFEIIHNEKSNMINQDAIINKHAIYIFS